MTNIAHARVERIQRGMEELDLDASVFLKPQNVFYLSNWNSVVMTNPTFVVVPRVGEAVLLAWSHRAAHAREEAWLSDLRLFGHWGAQEGIAPTGPEAVQSILSDWKARRVGIEMEYLPVAIADQLRSVDSGRTVHDVSPLAWAARFVKDAEELRRLRVAGILADAGMQRALEVLREGVSEAEVSVAAECAMRTFWATNHADGEIAGFPGQEGGVVSGLWCWCQSGPRISLPADTPSDRRVQRGEPAFIAIWATYEGYLVENERTVIIGKASPLVNKAFECMIRAREAAIARMRPHVPVAEVYAVAMGVYRSLGFADQRPGRIGHGIGLGGHEKPSVAGNDPTVLQEGMVLTMEPSLFVEGTGLRHSDTVIVGADAPEILTTTSRGILRVET
jgi:Xaa-Pro dipeptidase